MSDKLCGNDHPDKLKEIQDQMHKLCNNCQDLEEDCFLVKCEWYQEMLCYAFDERGLERCNGLE